MIIAPFRFSLPEWFGSRNRHDSADQQKVPFQRKCTQLVASVNQRFAPLVVVGLLAVLGANLLMLPNASAQGEIYEIEDRGDFVLYFMPALDEPAARVANYLAGPSSGVLEQVVDDLNAEFNLAESVMIVFATWADIDDLAEEDVSDRAPEAFFDRNGTDNIYISYEFMAKILGTLDGDLDAWHLNVINVVLHEVGHALIHVNQIIAPVEGADPERDADEVAFFVLVTFYEAEDELDLVAEHFWRIADEALFEEYDHLPDQERAERYECWIDGSFDDGSLTCMEMYDFLMDTWDDRLGPSWKDPFGEY